MGNRLEGKVAIVTGAGSSGPGVGTGRAAAILFAREGARVLLADVVPAAAEETLALIKGEGGEAAVCAADVTRPEDCETMVRTAVTTWGRLDILDNNVGIIGPPPGSAAELDGWERVLRVNLTAMMLAGRAAAPAMANTGGGSIICISSTAGVRPPGVMAYSVAKSGVHALARGMAVEYAPMGIRCNVIIPGPIYTPLVAGTMTSERREARRRSTLLQVEGTGWDVGWAAVFLASDEARYVTGAEIPVDGGWLLAQPHA